MNGRPEHSPAAARARTSPLCAAVVATLAALIAGVAGCAPATPPAANILVRGNGPEPDSLDPQKARSVEAHVVLRDLYECLTSLAKDSGTAPGVATSWDVSRDGRVYTFHLRDNARWSNGDRVAGDDFVFALRRLVDPATASQYAQLIDVVENASAIVAGRAAPETLGVSAPDPLTVVVRLHAPAPYLPGLLSFPSTCPVHRPTLEREGARFTKPGVMVSNGAFVLTDWTPGVGITVTRNRRYWNDAATRLDGVRYLQIADESTEFTRYRAGDLHVTVVVPRAQYDIIRRDYAAELHVAPQLSTYYYGFALDRAPFKDAPGLRRALSLVIDREQLAEVVLRVGELPAYGWIPPGVHDYSSQQFDYAGRPMADRLAEARRLYAAAGYGAARPLRFELRYNSGEVHSRLAVAIAAMWKEALGVEAQLTAVEFRSLMADIDARRVEMFRMSWSGDYNDAYTFLQYLKSGFGINLPRYSNPAYDALLARASATVDPAARRALLEEAERTMLADTPLLPLYFYVNKHLVSPRVEGWYDNVLNVVYSKDLALRP
ncbi:MAG: peptide ABC transporter substrate-binding protein [Steroidobacteraceae bacterium]